MKRSFLLSAGLAGLSLAVLALWLEASRAPQTANPPAAARLVSTAGRQPVPVLSLSSVAEVPTSGATVEKSEIRPPAMAAFAEWVERFCAGDASISAALGEALAWQRRAVMRELIQTHPERALALTVPFAWRGALPANITRHFEQQVDGRGALNVAVATDFERGKHTVFREAEIAGERYQAFVHGRRLAQVSQPRIPLHGIALDHLLAVQSDPIRLVASEEASALEQQRGRPLRRVCSVCSQAGGAGASVADLGGELAFFCNTEHARLVNERWLAAEGGSAAGGGPWFAPGDSWTQGPKTLLYMRANFPDDLTEPISEASAYDVIDSVNAFYAEGSYDTTWLTATVTPLLTLPQTKGWYATAGPGALLTDARAAAHRAGFDTANYALDIVTHTTVPNFDWGGLGFVGGKGTWLQSAGVGVTAHELGHNYGLWHANFWDTTANDSIIGPGANVEYGNSYDTMGAAAAGNNQFNALFKNVLGWLPDPSILGVTTNGVYRLFPFDVPDRVNGRAYAAKLRKDDQREYWVEFRQKFTSNPWLQNGVLLDWSPWAESAGGTHLLDTTPGTPAGKQDAAVVIGRTFSDPAAGVHLTPLTRGATGTSVWMEVQINLGAFPSNHPPTLKVETDLTNAAPGALVHLHATASDSDGDPLAYAWTFDDLSFSTNNLPWTFHSWSASGDHIVRCVVSDMKGGVASANAIVTVGEPVGFRISGLVTDANGDAVEGVRVDNNPTNAADYLGGCTDSDGRYVIVGVTADLSLSAFKYGFAFTNLTWANPIAVTNDVLTADFLATPLPTVRLAASTNAVPEAGGATNFFTLIRTGELTNDLVLTLQLSGAATVKSDYTLAPALATGANTVTIPAGTNQVVFAFQALNDTLAEGPETVTLTLRDDPAYVLAPLAEATITILDDDLPSRPAVSLAAADTTIMESGADNATFVFTRSGATDSELTVYYSVSGTATPGVDYPTLPGVLVIPVGQASAAASFQPLDDKDVETAETITLTLAPHATYTGSSASATVTIVDDDVLTVTISPTGDGAAEPSSPGRFTVKRDGDLGANLVVHYTVSGTASNSVDYAALSGSVTIPAGATSTDIFVSPQDDDLLEGDESVILTLVGSAGYDVGTPGSATLFIRDNEKAFVSITATDDTAAEPGNDTGSFTVSRGSVKNGALTVLLAISGTAINSVDYVPLDSFVVIPDGASEVSLDVIPFDDLHLEPTETVILTLVATTNYNVGSPRQAAVEILDDDDASVPAAGFTFSTSSAPESESPGVSVSLSDTSAVPVTVNYLVIGGTASTNDYTLPPGTLTFAPGDRAKSIPLLINNDSLVEPNETIRLALVNPTNATLDGLKLHTYTIVDDDTASVSIAATAANALETGPVAGNFRISRTGATNAELVVKFQVTGTASAPTDCTPLGASVAIPAGATFADLPVVPVDDATVELSQTVVVTLISAPGARLVSPIAATVTISDNDSNSLPVVAISSTNHPFAVEGGGSGEFVISRAGPLTNALTIDLSISGTATSGADYLTLTNRVTIPIGQASVTLPVIPVDDTIVEGEETVVITVTSRDTYRVAYPGAALVTIQDNDQSVRLDASDFEAAEPGTDRGEFTFTRIGTTNTDLRVFFTISGTASNGVDYAAITNWLVIPAGSLAATLPIVPLDDALPELQETVTLTLQASAAYSLGQVTSGTVTILDDEPSVSVSATVASTIEGSEHPGVFTLTRGGDPRYDFTVRFAVGGTATYGVDYPPFLTNIVFPCGVMAVDFAVWATNELVVEPEETVTLSLLPDPAYSILAPSNAVVTIADAATNQVPTMVITSPSAPLVFLPGTNGNMILEAAAGDTDTNTPLVVTWEEISGPCPVTFGDTNLATTTVSFTNAGIYVLRVTAADGPLTRAAEVTVVVDDELSLAPNLLHWPFDEGSGTNVTDLSGTGHGGVLVGTPVWVTNGMVGGALSFAGTNTYVRATNDASFLNGLKAFGASLWIKSTPTNSDRGFLSGDGFGTNATLGLRAVTDAPCSHATNVIEATFTTSRGTARRVGAANPSATGWQHVTLTWTNHYEPELYVNGQLDHPELHSAAISGFLTNCPQFIAGQGPLDGTNSWPGLLDDVRLYSRLLNAGEAAALAALPATNYASVVDAGSNVTIQLIVPAVLVGMVTDDGRPNLPGTVSNYWLLASGPAAVVMSSTNSLTNSVSFTVPGAYVFRLVADDGQVKMFDDVTVTVTEPTLVNLVATDSEAAELGPDPGQFTLTRQGDTNFDLTIYLAIGGIASNGVDFVTLSNTITLPMGIESATLDVIPFLDHRTEGDQPVTLTILSNPAYTIGSGEATVTIHDSPYGMWTIAHFTLEELTDPKLSGEGADFDHDRLVNFAEYAANRDPKSAGTNGPLLTALAVDPADNLPHIMLTYPRRLPPTDAAYALAISSDLLAWNTGTNYFEEIQATDDGNGLTETVLSRVKAPWSTMTNTFLMLRVWLLVTTP